MTQSKGPSGFASWSALAGLLFVLGATRDPGVGCAKSTTPRAGRGVVGFRGGVRERRAAYARRRRDAVRPASPKSAAAPGAGTGATNSKLLKSVVKVSTEPSARSSVQTRVSSKPEAA